MGLLSILSGSKEEMNDLIVVVLAVPGPPTNSELPSTLLTRFNAYPTDRVQGWDHERGKLGPLLQLGVLPRRHTVHPRRPFSVVLVDVIPNRVSPGSMSGTLPLASSQSLALNLGRSSAGSMAPNDQQTQ